MGATFWKAFKAVSVFHMETYIINFAWPYFDQYQHIAATGFAINDEISPLI